ncbi:hypothetical protein ABPG75_005083 [Micractinium tetrahymenae]
MAKRVREDDLTHSQVVVDERGAKRHAREGAWALPENRQLEVPLPGWDLLPASKQHAPLAGLPLAGEPLRPANHDAAAAAAAAACHPQQQQQLEQQQQGQQQQAHQQQQQGQQQLAAALAAAGLGAGFSTHIDWRNPEQVAALLRALHLERLQRQGQQLPDEYRQ